MLVKSVFFLTFVCVNAPQSRYKMQMQKKGTEQKVSHPIRLTNSLKKTPQMFPSTALTSVCF